MLRRKKGLVLKVVLVIPVLWFCMVGMTVMLNGQSSLDDRKERDEGKDFIVQNAQNRPKNFQPEQPILEAPNPDWLRFQDKIKLDAAEELRRKEAEMAREKHQASNTPKIVQPPVLEEDPAPQKPQGLKPAYRPLNEPEVAEFDPKGPGRFSSIPRLCLSMLQ
jgi:hypothetical protein